METPMIENYDWDRLVGLYPADFIEKMKGLDGKACWEGYKLAGTKKKGGKTVDNCVKISDHAEEEETTDFGVARIRKYLRRRDHNEGDIATAEMTPNYLPKEPGKGDEKNPQMREGVPVRMPRMEEIEKAASKNGTLAMRARPNYSESEEYHEGLFSMEPNGAMAINQLRVMREKIDIMLGMLYPDDNLEPWMATKLAMSAQNLASVADYMRFGAEL
jgi:hypothetical protein